MPRQLSEQALNQIQYVSMADYIRRVDALTDFGDKMAFTTRYLLAYGNGENRDHTFAEAIHIARMKIADASAKARKQAIHVDDETVNPFYRDPELENGQETESACRHFIADPKNYLLNAGTELLNQALNAEDTAANRLKIDSYQAISNTLLYDERLGNDIEDLSASSTSRDVTFRLEGLFGGARGLHKAYADTKPGFLAKAFGKYSQAYSNLDAAYKAFHNPNHALYGNLGAIDKAAIEYLQHRFPTWKPSDGFPSQEAVDALSGTEKARTIFSMNLLRASAEQRRTEPVYETVVTANRQRNALAAAGVEEEAPAQANESFQEEVGNEVAEFFDAVEKEVADEEAYHENFLPIEEDPDVEP